MIERIDYKLAKLEIKPMIISWTCPNCDNQNHREKYSLQQTIKVQCEKCKQEFLIVR